MAIRFDEIQLSGTGHKFYPKLYSSGQYVQLQTEHGYLRLGPKNM